MRNDDTLLAGIDFTCSPSRRKPITIATGRVAGERLVVEQVVALDTLAAFERWLETPGPWLAAFDFPFGLPRVFVEAHALGDTCADVIAAVRARWATRMAWRAAIDAWTNTRPRGSALPPEDYAIADAGAAGVFSFGSAIIRTMQNWRDNLQRAAPGFRDRVLTIRHTALEGGLNLDMSEDDITAMAASGEAGAQTLIDAFARPADLASDHFTYHRWVRARSLLGVLQRMLRDIHQGATVLDNHPPYPDLIRDAPAYVGSSYRLSDGARDAAARLLDALDALDRELEAGNAEFARTAPRPEVELRIQPVL